jgi:hypothetical protein
MYLPIGAGGIAPLMLYVVPPLVISVHTAGIPVVGQPAIITVFAGGAARAAAEKVNVAPAISVRIVADRDVMFPPDCALDGRRRHQTRISGTRQSSRVMTRSPLIPHRRFASRIFLNLGAHCCIAARAFLIACHAYI